MTRILGTCFLTLLCLLVATDRAFAAKTSVEVKIKDREKTVNEYCLYLVIRNHKLAEVSLNVFGSQVLKDIDGAEAQFKLANTKNPSLNPNAKIPKGEVASGWSCWTIPSAAYKPATLVLKGFMGPTYAKIKLKETGRSPVPVNQNANANTRSSGSSPDYEKVLRKLEEIQELLMDIQDSIP